MSLDSASSQSSAPAYSPTSTVQITGRRWAVAAGHPLAAAAAARVLEAGGNAVDAGVAAGITLGTVHVDMVSVAGVAPILVHQAATRQTWQVAGVGPYPRKSTVDYFREKHGNQIAPGLARTVVPAAPDAW
jgi:gamma-glutamyltranspeptidase/glutathione hydrolase